MGGSEHVADLVAVGVTDGVTDGDLDCVADGDVVGVHV